MRKDKKKKENKKKNEIFAVRYKYIQLFVNITYAVHQLEESVQLLVRSKKMNLSTKVRNLSYTGRIKIIRIVISSLLLLVNGFNAQTSTA